LGQIIVEKRFHNHDKIISNS